MMLRQDKPTPQIYSYFEETYPKDVPWSQNQSLLDV